MAHDEADVDDVDDVEHHGFQWVLITQTHHLDFEKKCSDVFSLSPVCRREDERKVSAGSRLDDFPFSTPLIRLLEILPRFLVERSGECCMIITL